MTAPGTTLVFGAGGLLGRGLVRACEKSGRRCHAVPHSACDIAEPADVARAFACEPELAINAAGLTDVDRCEREPVVAYRVNALGPRVLERAAAACGARLVHVSTDYVFSGDTGGGPYTELDAPGPRSVYGRTKLLGEQACLEGPSDAAVIRTSWLFGAGGKSFGSRLPWLLRERGRVSVVSDQVGSPTSAEDLADWIVRQAHALMGGLYHVVNEGAATYVDLALRAADRLGLDAARVEPVSGHAFAHQAPRPRYSALATVALPAEGLPGLRPWTAAYDAYLGACQSCA